MVNWINLILTTLNIASFMGAAFFFFKNNKSINWKKLIKIQIVSMSIWFLEVYLLTKNLSSPYSARIIGAIIIQVFSFVVFWTTISYIGKHKLLVAGSEEKPLHFFSTGPFQYVRHPFYSTYLLSYLGTFIADSSYPFLILIMMLIYFYYKTAREEEGRFDLSEYKEGYAEYKSKTGMFVPWLN